LNEKEDVYRLWNTQCESIRKTGGQAEVEKTSACPLEKAFLL